MDSRIIDSPITADALRIIKAFFQVTNPTTRRKIIELVEELARTQAETLH